MKNLYRRKIVIKMTKANDVREIVIAHHINKVPVQDIFEKMAGKVSRTTIHRWIKQYKATGTTSAKKPTGRPPKASNANKIKAVKRLINSHSQRQVAKRLEISQRTVGRILKTLHLHVTTFIFKI